VGLGEGAAERLGIASRPSESETIFDRRQQASMDLAKLEKAEKVLGVGRFEVSALLQKRVQEIIRGAPPLVRIRSDNPIEIALEEILHGRVTLVRSVEEEEDLLDAGTGFSAEMEGEEEPEALSNF